MVKSFQVLFALAILGVFQTSTLAKSVDPKGEEIKNAINAGLKEIGKISAEVEKWSHEASANLHAISDSLLPLVNEALNNVNDKMDTGIGAVEKRITDLTGFDLVKQTCGVVDFHTIVTKTLDNVKSCAFDELNKSLNNIHKILNGIEDIAKLIQEPMSNIKGCVSGDFEKVKACVDENVGKAKSLFNSLKSISSGVKGTIEIARFKAMLTACVTKSSVNVVANKSKEVISCVGDIIPGLKEEIEKIKNAPKKAVDFITNETKQKLEEVQQAVTGVTQNVANEVSKTYKDVEEKATEILKDVLSELKKVWDRVTGWFNKLG